ncbi:PD-(D/E)XK nuclease family protein [Sulfoacidibacillus thermotolerans]|uniref:PD-(D/E)XK endonuclease-like domain-containing protein n=1 Tax=Sulfoacidibacillus thermotolerans TaxID=1765684 RepID=A0A2U3D469_SULT2|nr:PD-(D/E)XK nuclease family protein [Sulfoacidibacillus thermotolerans]PWI56054.1 hypothetical protein BM613_13195 [Sulfoacidibacillus thermotolerans]
MEKLTNSRISARQRCPQKEHYQYVERLRPVDVQWPLVIGSAWHRGLEMVGGGGDEEEAVRGGLETFGFIQPQDEEAAFRLQLEKVRTEVMIRQAVRRFTAYPFTAVEQEFTVPIINPASGRKSRKFVLGGKMDGIVEANGKYWLIENKTTGMSLDVYRTSYGLSNQLTLYLYAASKAFGHPLEGAIMRTIVKTQTKPKMRAGVVIEDWDEYKDRLMGMYDEEPERFIAEDFVYRTSEQIERFEKELWAETQERLWQDKTGMIRHNTSACNDYGGCPFKPLCLGIEGARDSLFRVSETVHDELPSESA